MDLRSHKGQTPLHLASDQGHHLVIEVDICLNILTRLHSKTNIEHLIIFI